MATGEEKKPRDERKGFSFEELDRELDDAEVVFGTAKGRQRPPEPEPIEAPEGGTVFADLISDQPRRDEPEMPRTAEEFEALAAKQAEDQLNTRVLTQSAQPSTPLWLSSLLVAGLAVLLLVMLIRGGREGVYRSILGYAAMLISVGGILWAGSGAMHPGSVKEQRVCIAAAVVCLTVGIIALIIKINTG